MKYADKNCPWCGSKCVVQPNDNRNLKFQVDCVGYNGCSYLTKWFELECDAISQHEKNWDKVKDVILRDCDKQDLLKEVLKREMEHR